MPSALGVGAGTFSVSFFAVVWLLLFFATRRLRSGRCYNACGATMLAIVIVVLATLPTTPTITGSDAVFSRYWPSAIGVGAVLALSLCASLCGVCWWELSTVQRAKLVEGRDLR